MRKGTLNERCTMKNVRPCEISTFCILHFTFRLRFSAMEWTPPAVRHHCANGESASLKAKARRSPHGAYDHRRRPRKVGLSNCDRAPPRPRRRGASAVTSAVPELFCPAAVRDDRPGSVWVGAPLGARAATVGPYRAVAARA